MAEEARNYDLIVIGGGPAGIFGATTGAMAGMSAALIDRSHELGGVEIAHGDGLLATTGGS